MADVHWLLQPPATSWLCLSTNGTGFLALPPCPGWIQACTEKPWHTLSPAEAPGPCQPLAFQSLAASYPEGWQLVLFSHPKNLPKELGQDPAPVLGLPGLALALISACLPSSANRIETLLDAKFCNKN